MQRKQFQGLPRRLTLARLVELRGIERHGAPTRNDFSGIAVKKRLKLCDLPRARRPIEGD
jgi:hypothetical protein